jgi:hypothetical protein
MNLWCGLPACTPPVHGPWAWPWRPRALSLILAFTLPFCSLTFASEPSVPPPPPDDPTDLPTLLLVVGAPGEPEFGTNFVRQAENWSRAAAQAQVPLTLIGLGSPATSSISPDLPDAPTTPAPDRPEEADASGTSPPADVSSPSQPADRELLAAALAAAAKSGREPLWLVLIGHGTFDGREARFNLRGPDLTATELADWLKPFERPLVLINTASASAPFLAALSGTNRIVITATRSGHEQNFTRFGDHLAATLADPASDFDQDGQTSLLEAFLSAAARVAEFYQTAGRLATEHALLDDNGDGLGTPADWFRGVRAVKRPQPGAASDGARAQQLHLVPSPEEAALAPAVRARRDALELDIFRLRDRKASLLEDDYYGRLESLLLELAALLVPPAPAAPSRIEITSTNHHGWPDALRLANGQVEAIVVPAIGRLMQFRFLGEPGPFWENPARFGQAPDPDASEWGNFGGDKTWPAPQADWERVTGRSWPPPRAFDALPVTATQTNGAIVLTSPVDPHFGIRTQRHLTLEPDQPVLRIRTVFEKVTGPPVRVSVWVVTQLNDPVAVFVPVPTNTGFPKGYLNQSAGEPLDLEVRDGLLSLRRKPEQGEKIGNDAGALLWVGEQHLLLVECPRTPEGEYPDGGASAEVWTNPDPLPYIELETLGPLQTLDVGDRLERTNTYTLLRRSHPDARADARHVLR